MDRRTFLRTVCSGGVAGGAIPTGCLERIRESDEETNRAPLGPAEENPELEWQLVFNDEFDSGELDVSVWNVGYGWGRQHFGWEYVRDEDVWVNDETDRLVLRADYDESYGPLDGENEPYHWYSGGVNTRHNFFQKHGYWEARIRLPEPVNGVTPAFWAKPNTEEFPPELDIMEHFTVENETWSAVHWGRNELGHIDTDDDDINSDYSSFTHEEDPRETFVIYGAHWREDRTDFYVDGYRHHTVSDGHSDDPGLREMNYCEPFYMMLSTQFSDGWGDPAQYDDYPYVWEVDWVRVWEDSGDGETDA